MAEAKKKTPPSPKPKRRRLWLKLLLLFGVLLVLAVLFGPMLVPGSTLGRIAASLAEGSLKRETTIESASFNVFSGFHAEGIEVQRRDGFGNGTLVEIGKVSGTIDYAAFLRLNVGIAQVSVEDVDASIVRDKEGVLNIQDLLDQPKSAITLTVGRVQAKDVKVTVRDKGLDITQSVKVAEADISAASDGKRTLSVSTKLPSGGTAVIEGTANLPADLAFKGADVTVVVEGFPALRVANEVARLTKFRSDREKAWIESFEQALVDAKLTVTVSAEKTATVEGTATVRELPELPEFGFTDADRTLALTLKGDGSIEKQHIELAAAAADAPFLTATVDATAESDTKRLVTLKAALPDGFTTDVNASIITTDEGEFASAEATLKVASSPAAALGLKLLRTLPLAPGVREQVDNAAGHIRKAGAEGIRVDADLQIVGFAERRIQIDGTVTARDLPAIPQLAFEGDERRVDLTLTGVVISPKKQHIELAIASQPGNALRARAVIDPIDETVAAFNLDNYTIDALLEVAADFAQGGLPGTPLAAGKATTRITVTGDLSGLEIKTDAALADGKVTLSADTAADLPPLTLAADAVVAPFDFTATLRKATLETEGFATTATGALKPIEADVNVGAVMPALEFQADAVTTGDFSKLPQALRKLIGMAADGAMKGTLEEKAKILVRTHALKDWKDAAKLRQVLDTVTVTGGLDVRQFAFQDAAPADLKATFDATARAADLSVTFRETAIQGPGIQGSLNGTLRLAKDAEPSELPGHLSIDLGTLAKQYGSLLGLPAGLEVRGAIASDVTIRREGAFVDAKGAATVTDLFLGGEAWKWNPVVEKLAKAVYDTRLDIDKMTLTIGAFDVASSRATAKAKGVLVLPGGEGKSNFTLQAAADMALAKLIPGLPEPLRIREGSGWVDVACTVNGSLDDLTIAGSSATREGGLKIATSELAVQGNFTRTFTITRKGDL
ncbi:hypothetical protein HQ560_09150, partial [bacterium]|nr:hypothetical protein [bacterium]